MERGVERLNGLWRSLKAADGISLGFENSAVKSTPPVLFERQPTLYGTGRYNVWSFVHERFYLYLCLVPPVPVIQVPTYTQQPPSMIAKDHKTDNFCTAVGHRCTIVMQTVECEILWDFSIVRLMFKSEVDEDAILYNFINNLGICDLHNLTRICFMCEHTWIQELVWKYNRTQRRTQLSVADLGRRPSQSNFFFIFIQFPQKLCK